MPRVTTEAVALRRSPFGETSQVAEFLTRARGRTTLILKGVHRPRSRKGGSVDLLDVCEVTWTERHRSRALATLSERRVLGHHRGMRGREDLLRAGLAWVELLRGVIPFGQRVPGVFGLVVAGLEALDARPAPDRVAPVVFTVEGGLLRMAGFEPVLDRCVSCGRKPERFHALNCDARLGGVVCSACRREVGTTASFPLSAAAARALRALVGRDPRALEDVTLPPPVERDLRRFYDSTWLHVLERPLRCRWRPLASPHPRQTPSNQTPSPTNEFP